MASSLPQIHTPNSSDGVSPSRGGEFLLQLLQQGAPDSRRSYVGDADYSDANGVHLISRTSSSGSGGTGQIEGNVSFSRSSSIEASAMEEEQAQLLLLDGIGTYGRPSAVKEEEEEEEEQARIHVQDDPAVACMGPSHPLGEVSTITNSLLNINMDGSGRCIQPFQDVHSFQQHHYLHQHHHYCLAVQPPPSFDLPFPAQMCSVSSDHGPPSSLDPLFWPNPLFQSAANQSFRPHPHSQLSGADHDHYMCLPAPSFAYTGMHNPKRLQDMTCTIPYAGMEQPKPFPNSGMPSRQQLGHLNSSYRDAETFPITQQDWAAPKSQLFTQFGSIGAEIPPNSDNKKGTLSAGLQTSGVNLFQQPFPTNRGEGVSTSSSPVDPTIQEGRPNPQASTEVKDGTMHTTPNAPLIETNVSSGQHKPYFADEHCIGTPDRVIKASASHFTDGKDSDSNFKLKGAQRTSDLSRKGAIRISSPHWIAVTKDRLGDVATMGTKSGVTIKESSSKLSDEGRRHRFQTPGWRMKQPNAGSHTELQSRNGGVAKSDDSGKGTGRSKSNGLLQQDPVGLPSGTKVDSAPSSETEQSKQALQGPPSAYKVGSIMPEAETDLSEAARSCGDTGVGENMETILGCVGFLELDKDNETEEGFERRNELVRSSMSKDVAPEVKQTDSRVVVRPTKFNNRRGVMFHRTDVEKCSNQFLAIFKSLIPPTDEEVRRKQLLLTLSELVSGIWPKAHLYLFGSCANAFGVCNSDIDVCLSIDGESSSRSEVVQTLADILTANNMQNVQALTHARVPIVKYSDPETGISCDVCVNNMLAVVNTKLLHDYAQVDVRLRQLAFVVKHWAKCRQVNETYRGTLSSYAYVLMCIHFLQQRKPPVLPCLQEMEPTYRVTVGEIQCAYFDRVDKLKGFGQKNRETLADLVVSFFDYWAFRHDYSHTVISIRTGRFLSKLEKDWTRRIGNERHLICIEDPFETSHDLGRVVDKHSIRVLRDEFQRAAKIMRHDDNPCVVLFEPYVRQKGQAA